MIIIMSSFRTLIYLKNVINSTGNPIKKILLNITVVVGAQTSHAFEITHVIRCQMLLNWSFVKNMKIVR